MLAYAPTTERAKFRPAALIAIVAVHAAALAALMAARMDLPAAIKRQPTEVVLIDPPKPPPPEPRRTPEPPAPSQLDRPVPRIPVPLPLPDPLPAPLPSPAPGPSLGNSSGTAPVPLPSPRPAPLARTGPRFDTPADRIRPPYPEAKLASGEEAVLRLRLSIDAAGRVTAVDPVGAADPAFLAAARRHILRVWRYRPATDGGQAVASSTVITLEFRLD